MERAISAAGEAIGVQEFSDVFDRLTPGPSVAVAVSGGADSMALLLLAQRWAAGHGARIVALTVDHGLRPGSAAEAAQVAQWCSECGIPHQILRWPGEMSGGGIQASARRARYRLLAAECARLKIPSLVAAHHLQDQAETFVMRLARGSGVDGLSGMQAESAWAGVRLLRPLLEFSKSRLTATLRAAGQAWIEDPSNRDPQFARPRVRAALDQLAAAGLSAERLAAAARRMSRARKALDQASDALLRTAVQLAPAGFAILPPAALARAPEEIGLRALSRLLMTLGGHVYPGRMARLERVYDWLAGGAPGGGRTLMGCRIIPARAGVIIVREPAAIGPDLALLPGETQIWDSRFRVRLTADAVPDSGPYEVRAVGGEGMRQIRQDQLLAAGAKPGSTTLPRLAGVTTPGLWRGGEILAAPLLGFGGASYGEMAHGFTAAFAPIRHLLPKGCEALLEQSPNRPICKAGGGA